MPPDSAQKEKPRADFRGLWYFFDTLKRPAPFEPGAHLRFSSRPGRPANSGRSFSHFPATRPRASAQPASMAARRSSGSSGRKVRATAQFCRISSRLDQ